MIRRPVSFWWALLYLAARYGFIGAGLMFAEHQAAKALDIDHWLSIRLVLGGYWVMALAVWSEQE